MNLGVLKRIADKISALLYAVCGDGDARRGPKDETLVAANERISHMGRLVLATQAPPGYVGCRTSCFVMSDVPLGAPIVRNTLCMGGTVPAPLSRRVSCSSCILALGASLMLTPSLAYYAFYPILFTGTLL